MADNDLELHVKTSADLTALKETGAALDDLAERTKQMATNWRETGTLRPAPGLTEISGPFGAGFGGAGKEGLTSVAADMQRSEQAAMGFGLNLARARNEAIILAREVATGTVNMRTLSALLGSLGAPFAIAGVEAMVVVQSLRKGIEEAAKFNEELKKEAAIVGENAEKWREIAQTAASPEMMDSLVNQMVPALEQVNVKLGEINEKQLSLKQRFIENTAAIDKLLAPLIGWNPNWFDPKMFQQGLDQTKSFFSELRTEQLDAQRQALQTSQILQDAFEADKLRPTAEVIDELNRKIETIKFLMASLPDPFGEDIKTTQELRRQLEAVEKELNAINNIDQQRHKTADEAYGKADENVKRVLMNEKAATEARKAGNEQDAAMFDKSAEAYKAGLLPAQQQQLANLKELQRQAYGAPAGTAPPSAAENIEANRRAFEAYWKQPGMAETMAGTGGPGMMSKGELPRKPYETVPEQKMSNDAIIKAIEALGQKMDNLWR